MSAQTLPTITTILGDSRQTDKVYPDGSFNCPYCWAAVPFPATTCPNPGCDSSPYYTVETLTKVRAERAAKLAEDEQRKRNHELAMERIRQDKIDREKAEDSMRQEARETGVCYSCLRKTGKRIKHRAECPRMRPSIYASLGMRRVRGSQGGVYYE